MSKLLVTGSLAYDRIATFQGHFGEHLLPDKVHQLNVAFNVDRMSIQFGGTGGNIAYSLALLGEDPILLGTLGDDYEEYKNQLLKNNISTDHIKIIEGALTANATIMTDLDDNQITAFYTGAMQKAHQAKIEAIEDPIELAIISPNGIKAIQEYPEILRQKQIPFIADPGQSIPALSKDDLINLITGAHILIVNDYEWHLVTEKTDLTLEEIFKKTNLDHLIVTLGEKGAKIWNKDSNPSTPVEIPAHKPEKIVDPTGCGDAFRAGLMYGIKNQKSIKESAQIGALLAAKAIEHNGTQNHDGLQNS
jgi:adenosine kinase